MEDVGCHTVSVASPVINASGYASPSLLLFLNSEISPAIVDHVVASISAAVDISIRRTSGINRLGLYFDRQQIRDFRSYVNRIFRNGRVTMMEVVAIMTYTERIKNSWAGVFRDLLLEEMFVSALVLATKYLNDECHHNSVWVPIVEHFSSPEMEQMLRHFLYALDWKLRIIPADLLHLYNKFYL
ncbi:hypothetical protein GYMLUDRAFT_241587 [Collybiopsis luxurians FD-317 M1]|uniref:Cyclin N-terminal domain-containing protein n=1 Tax=Collybiopsis luxurians FD-317 M1 TaxID=944289 RepID=A0A0D0C6B8_9AGAR|nr:hypothetical protein GYMLUDRAFT_241587 [Collybiopsis luxurians FD-317 M1]